MRSIVLTFHNVTDAVWFEQCLRLIGRFYQFAAIDTLAAAVEQKRCLRSKCFVTFDDGEKSFYEVAYPVLKRMNIPATIFVSPKNIIEGGSFWFQCLRDIPEKDLRNTIATILPNGTMFIEHYSVLSILKTLPLQTIHRILEQAKLGVLSIARNINEVELKVLAADPLITIGAHTLTHPILANETDVDSAEQITESVRQLRELLHRPIQYFAYPNGNHGLDYAMREINVLQQIDIRLAFSTNVGLVGWRPLPYEINRVGLTLGSRWHILAKILFPRTFVWLRNLHKFSESKERRLIKR